MCLKADKTILDAFFAVSPKIKTDAGWRGEATAEEPALVTSLWGMLYADDAGVVWLSPKHIRKIMGVNVIMSRRLTSPYRRPRLGPCAYA